MASPTAAVSSEPLVTSPTLSAVTSTSSYDLLSDCSPSSLTVSQSLRFTDNDSDDEIVWTVSEGSLSPGSSESDEGAPSDDDYVVLRRPRSPVMPLAAVNTGLSTPVDDEDEGGGVHTPVTASMDLVAAMKGLSLTAPEPRLKKTKRTKATQQPASPSASSSKQRKPKAKKKKKATAARPADNAYPTPAPSPKASRAGKPAPSATKPIQVNGTSDWFEEMSVVKYPGLGARAIVDDYSDRQSIISYDNESVGSPTLYEEASTFISSFLSNPDAKSDNVCRLTLLQSLIIELGLATPSLPESLTAAKAFLKSRAFLNIREYLAVRGQGPEAVQQLLYPSKSALIKDIKKKRNPASLKWVKEHGLQVLLVGWMR